MSGDACQRGETSTFSKHTRARAALAVGADLVLELPFPSSCASAAFFAFGAMSVISALGCIDTLGFGCEAGDAETLCAAALQLSSPEFEEEYRKMRESSPALGAAAQMSRAFENIGGDASLLSGANNVLAIEYIKAAWRLGLSLDFSAVARMGAGHGEGVSGGFASASYIRKALGGGELLREFLPDSCADIFEAAVLRGDISLGAEHIGDAVLTHFRLLDESSPETAQSTGGLLSRMEGAAHKACNYAEFIEGLKTKKYTDARLRRAVLFSMCGVTEHDLRQKPEYTTLLAASERGTAMLSEVKKSLGMPIVSNPSMLRGLPETAKRQKTLSRRIAALRALTKKVPSATEDDLSVSPTLVQSSHL